MSFCGGGGRGATGGGATTGTTGVGDWNAALMDTLTVSSMLLVNDSKARCVHNTMEAWREELSVGVAAPGALAPGHTGGASGPEAATADSQMIRDSTRKGVASWPRFTVLRVPVSGPTTK